MAVAVVGVGCSRENPLFGESIGTTGTGQTEAESSTGSGSDKGDSGTISAGSGDMPDACPPGGPQPYRVVSMPNLPPVDCGMVQSIAFSRLEQNPMSFRGQACTECPCGMPLREEFSVELDAPLPELPVCFVLELWWGPPREGQCVLEGYTIHNGLENNDFERLSVVSNMVEPPHFELGLMLGQVPISICGSACEEPRSGVYPLALNSGGPTLVIEPGDQNVQVGEFRLTNEASGIDADCREFARWYALSDGP